MWDHIRSDLNTLRRFFDHPNGQSQVTIVRDDAFIKNGATSTQERRLHTFHLGDIVIVDGKFSNNFSDLVDLHVRVTDDPQVQRQRYQQDRAASLNGPELAELMRYYDLIYPSWAAYDQSTRNLIDIEVDLKNNRVIDHEAPAPAKAPNHWAPKYNTEEQNCITGLAAAAALTRDMIGPKLSERCHEFR